LDAKKTELAVVHPFWMKAPWAETAATRAREEIRACVNFILLKIRDRQVRITWKEYR
jgi:hypothetical protein